MSQFEPENISAWLRMIATTEDHEIDCDAFAGVVESVVEAGARGEDIHTLLPELALHLEHCPDCREWYETLVELAGQFD